jgi:hypothetical protein
VIVSAPNWPIAVAVQPLFDRLLSWPMPKLVPAANGLTL